MFAIPLHGLLQRLAMGSWRPTESSGIFAAIEQVRLCELIEHLHRLAQHWIGQPKQPQHYRRRRQRTRPHPRYLARQGNEFPSSQRWRGGYVPDLAPGLLVCSQCDESAREVLAIRERVRRVEFTQPGDALAAYQRVEQLLAHSR